MKPLSILFAVLFAVNLVAAPATTKTAPQKTDVQQTAPDAKEKKESDAGENLLIPEGVDGTPLVNPQPAPQPLGETTAVAPQAADAPAITGTVDIRPSHYVDTLRTENYLDLGYKTGNHHFIIEQDFNTNLYNPSSTTGYSGADVEIRDTFLRYKYNNVWESDDKVFSLSYELRPFLPTFKSRRDAGMITIVRNYAKFAAKVSDSVTLSLWEIPIAHIYNRSGNFNSAGEAVPNAAFENRIYFIADWSMSERWSLSFPLMLNSARLREFGGKGGNWDHYLWIYPELDYAIDANYTVGLSWYNDAGFTKGDLSETTLESGFKNGVTQLVFRATL